MREKRYQKRSFLLQIRVLKVNTRFLDSVNYNLVRKIILHVGVKVLSSGKFEKILGAGDAQQEIFNI